MVEAKFDHFFWQNLHGKVRNTTCHLSCHCLKGLKPSRYKKQWVPKLLFGRDGDPDPSSLRLCLKLRCEQWSELGLPSLANEIHEGVTTHQSDKGTTQLCFQYWEGEWGGGGR